MLLLTILFLQVPEPRWVPLRPDSTVALDSTSAQAIGTNAYRVVLRRRLRPTTVVTHTTEVHCGQSSARTVGAQRIDGTTEHLSAPWDSIAPGSPAAHDYEQVCRLASAVTNSRYVPFGCAPDAPLHLTRATVIRILGTRYQPTSAASPSATSYEAYSVDSSRVLMLTGPANELMTISIGCRTGKQLQPTPPPCLDDLLVLLRTLAPGITVAPDGVRKQVQATVPNGSPTFAAYGAVELKVARAIGVLLFTVRAR